MRRRQKHHPQSGLPISYTLAEAREILREHGISLRKTDGEYRVTYAGLRGEEADAVAYFTDHLDDAVDTGRAMARAGHHRVH